MEDLPGMENGQKQHDPYRPPKSDIETNIDTDFQDRDVDPLDVESNIASTGQRLANFVLDYIFIYVSVIIVIFVVYIPATVFGFEETLNKVVDAVPDMILGAILFLCYYVPLEALTGRTIAKFITRTRVVSEDGSPPSIGQVVGRTFCRFLPFEAFSFLGGNPVGWHDRIPKTRVITTKYLK